MARRSLSSQIRGKATAKRLRPLPPLAPPLDRPPLPQPPPVQRRQTLLLLLRRLLPPLRLLRVLLPPLRPRHAPRPPPTASAPSDSSPTIPTSPSHSPCCAAADEIAAFALRRGAQELSLDFMIRPEKARAESISCLEDEVKYSYIYNSLRALPLSLLKLSPSLRVLRLKDCRLRLPSTPAAAAAGSSLLAPQLERRYGRRGSTPRKPATAGSCRCSTG